MNPSPVANMDDLLDFKNHSRKQAYLIFDCSNFFITLKTWRPEPTVKTGRYRKAK